MLRCYFYIFLFLVVFGEFVANEKPLYCKIDKEVHFPVAKQWLANMNLTAEKKYTVTNWRTDEKVTDAIFTIVPYSYFSQDEKNRGLVSPLATQTVDGWRYRHWLGTNQLGQDVLAGIINGFRVAGIIGFLATTVALLLSVLIGVFAGFYENKGFKLSIFSSVFLLLAIPYSGFITSQFYFSKGFLLFFTCFFIIIAFIFFVEKKYFKKYFPKILKVNIPLDIIFSSLIDLKRSIPNIVFILLFLSIFSRLNVFGLSILLGVLTWMNTATLLKEEIIRIKKQDFVTAAIALGIDDFRIIKQHILPNIMLPILISVTHMVSGYILAETTLSFLGLGLSVELTTWGSLLHQAQENIYAWWLALFPGLCVFSVSWFANQQIERLRLKQ